MKIHWKTEPIPKGLSWTLWAIPVVLFLTIPNAAIFAAALFVLLTTGLFAPVRAATCATVWRTVLASLLIGLICGTVIHFVSHYAIEPAGQLLVGEKPDLSTFDGVRGNLKNYLILLAVGIVIGGVLEELVFRGFLVGWGSRLAGAKTAPFFVLFSAVLFGLVHRYQGASGMIVTGVIGILYGAVYLGAGRKLLPAMTTHAVANVWGVTYLYLGVNGA